MSPPNRPSHSRRRHQLPQPSTTKIPLKTEQAGENKALDKHRGQLTQLAPEPSHIQKISTQHRLKNPGPGPATTYGSSVPSTSIVNYIVLSRSRIFLHFEIFAGKIRYISRKIRYDFLRETSQGRAGSHWNFPGSGCACFRSEGHSRFKTSVLTPSTAMPLDLRIAQPFSPAGRGPAS